MKPRPIYNEFSRELLENFVYQLQQTVFDYQFVLEELRYQPDEVVHFIYSFECPDLRSADELKKYLRKQTSEQIDIRSAGEFVDLSYHEPESELCLPTVLEQVGYLCDAGSQFGCRFDGWTLEDAVVRCQIEVAEQIGSLPTDCPEFQFEKKIVIPGLVPPIDRGEDYVRPINRRLDELDAGMIVRAASARSQDKQYVTYLYLGTNHPDLAIQVLREFKRETGFPIGTHASFQENIYPL